MGDEQLGRPKAILIAGPTASGKSALALELAERLHGMVINADSMQVYADLAIVTARPSAADEARAPHRLYGTIDGAVSHSVTRWLDECRAVLADAERQARLPILVGGTGLYFKALTQGLSPIPDVPEPVRAATRRWAEGRSAEQLHEALRQRDPLTASKLRPTDPQRILRALEVHVATGESLASFQSRRETPTLPAGSAECFTLHVPRPVLRARIDARFDAMIGAGALEEVDRLRRRQLDPTLPVMRAIGVPQLSRHLAGAASLADAIAEAKAVSRHYIKRQETFARTQLYGFRPLTAEQILQAATAAFQSFA